MAMLACVSHSPLILARPRAPPAEPDIHALAERFRLAVEAFEPQQVIFFGNNHFAGFHYSNMPSFCIGTECTTVADLGGFAGTLDVPAHDAIALLEHLRAAGFDPSVSYRMRADHAFSQPLQRLLGGIARYPVIPIFVSVFTPPFMKLGRSRLFGASVGRWAAACGKRTLVMGTGGLSHHPAHYFPLLGSAPADVHAYQLDAERGGTMTDEEWLARFERMHIEGGQALSQGLRGPRDIRLNREVDERILRALCGLDLDVLDDWDQTALVEEAGIGVLEIHTWLAATSAYRQLEPTAALNFLYAEVVEYGGGYGMLHSL